MDFPLISVIIPIYNTERYLDKCVQSVFAQTYRNLEIFLIDDGSPDRCGGICDVFAMEDSRVRVIHQKNVGQSAARNAGMAASTGEYFAFVDSDDYIEPDMFSYLYSLLDTEKADISVCGFRRFTGENVAINEEKEENVKVLGNRDAMEALVEDKWLASQPCNKLFKRFLFDGIAFPVGRVYEDLAVMHRIFGKAEKIVVSFKLKYNYLMRSESTSTLLTAASAYGLFAAFRDRHVFMEEKYPALADMVQEQALGTAIGMYIHWQMYPRGERIKAWEKEVRDYILRNRSGIAKSGTIRFSRKLDGICIAELAAMVRLKYHLYYFLKKKRDKRK